MRKSRTIGRAAAAGGSEQAPVLAPFRRVAEFWNWLPAFRAVAEWGGVVHAARTLRTSASALSRAVRLLEAATGAPLFRREGRRLALTAAGEELLSATRLAMRSVDDVTSGDGRPRGLLRVAATSRLGTIRLLPALSAMRKQSPDVHPVVASIAHDDVIPALLSARIDVALTLARVEHADLRSVALAPADSAVFCGPSHPLWRTPAAPASRVLRHAFAAPERPPSGASLDGWPDHLARRITLRSSVIEPGIDACVRGELLAVLPLEVVAAHAPGARLRALRAIAIPNTSLFAVRRRRVSGRPSAADLLMESLAVR